MELRQLKYFQTVCLQKNYTRAAELLCISQPTITASIQKLEEELGVILLDRNQKKIEITPEGMILFQRAKEILSLVNDTVMEIADYAQLKKGKVCLGVTPMVGAYIFPQIFMEFKQRFPEITLNIIEEGTSNIKKKLEDGSLDIGIGILSASDDFFETVPFSINQLLVCVSEEHPFSAKQKITLEELHKESLILLKEGFYLRELISEYFKKNSFSPIVALSSNQLETIKSLVAKNVGISILFDNVIANTPDLIGIPLKTPLYITSGLIWKKGNYLSKASQAFREFVIEKNIDK